MDHKRTTSRRADNRKVSKRLKSLIDELEIEQSLASHPTPLIPTQELEVNHVSCNSTTEINHEVPHPLYINSVQKSVIETLDYSNEINSDCQPTELFDNASDGIESEVFDFEGGTSLVYDEQTVHEIPEQCSSESLSSSHSVITDLTEIVQLVEEYETENAQPPNKLQSALAEWVCRNNLSHRSVDELLSILRDNGHPHLPKSAKTLLKTPRNTIDKIISLAGGTFWYHGILEALKPHLSDPLLENKTDISIDVFIDGVSPYKSVRQSIWPIAGCLVGSDKPFIIALWLGNLKEPSNVSDFFRDFIQEAGDLMRGFTVNNKEFKLIIRNYIADAPARAFMRKVKQHNSYYSCERCHMRGEWSGKVIFNTSEDADLRSDDTFARKVHTEHHTGVMKRILKMLLEPKASKHKITSIQLKELNSLMISYALFFPSEFARKPRDLSEWKLYKATELRRILLYDGVLIFNALNNRIVYRNFLLLHCALRILADEALSDFLDDAEHLLCKFVQHAGSEEVFGEQFVVYNIHHLTHLANECRLHGTIENFSAFKYENFLGLLKNLLHTPGRTLSQIVCRLIEKEHLQNTSSMPRNDDFLLSQSHSNGPLGGLLGHQFMKIQFPRMMIKISKSDSCCRMKSGDIVVVENIVQTHDKAVWVIGRAFEKREDFFTYPMESSLLGILKVSVLGVLCKWSYNEVCKKNVLLPLTGASHDFLCIPLLHNC